MGLSEKEKHGIAELLGRMERSDLYSLAQTVTSRLILPETPSEAVSAIILHTDRAIDLLRRRKVKRELLYKYLHAKRVEGVDVSSKNADKTAAISHVLALWDSPKEDILSGFSLEDCFDLARGNDGEEDSLPEAPAPSRNTSYSSLCSLDLYTNNSQPAFSSSRSRGPAPPTLSLLLSRTQSAVPSSGSSASLVATAGSCTDLLRRSESDLSLMDDQDSNSCFLPMVTLSTATPTSSGSSSCSPASGVTPTGTAGSTPQPVSLAAGSAFVQEATFKALAAHTQGVNGAVSSNISPCQAQDLADTFAQWFYTSLNSSLGNPASDAFRPDHFFCDASAKISIAANDAAAAQFVNVDSDGSEVCSALLSISRRFGLRWNPNLSRDFGVRGAMDPHGLVVVSVCGTLHTVDTCCGTFHQNFGLVRDPFESNNWKVKFTHASLVSKAVGDNEVPCLEAVGAVGAVAPLALSS